MLRARRLLSLRPRLVLRTLGTGALRIPRTVDTLVECKHTGLNPGLTMRDPLGRECSAKVAGRVPRGGHELPTSDR